MSGHKSRRIAELETEVADLNALLDESSKAIRNLVAEVRPFVDKAEATMYKANALETALVTILRHDIRVGHGGDVQNWPAGR